MDTDFSIAIHILILISESDEPLSSEQIAGSVGANASRIRKIAGTLRKASIIASRQGAKGFALTRDPGSITLLQIYDALYGAPEKRLLSIHKNPNDECTVGRLIQPTLDDVFAGVEAELQQTLERLSLADVIKNMRGRL